MDPLIGLGGIALGVALTWLASLSGAKREAGREHRRWLRERRYEAWMQLLGLGHQVSFSVRLAEGAENLPPDAYLQFMGRSADLFAACVVLGPVELMPKAMTLTDSIDNTLEPRISAEELSRRIAVLAAAIPIFGFAVRELLSEP
jgi:hypothetical protein